MTSRSLAAAAAVAIVPATLGALIWRGRVLRERVRSRNPFADDDA